MTTVLRNENGRSSQRMHRWIRQLHLWIGAWGALAAVLYGFTGLVMNHRFGDHKWPQGDSADGNRHALIIPVGARSSPEALSLWLRETYRLDAQVIRKPPPGETRQPARWSLIGGTAAREWKVEYIAGSEHADFKTVRHSALAALNRLHKAYDRSLGWRILSDSFAVCMILLGLSGIWMWARGRSAQQMAVSVLAASIATMALIAIPILF